MPHLELRRARRVALACGIVSALAGVAGAQQTAPPPPQQPVKKPSLQTSVTVTANADGSPNAAYAVQAVDPGVLGSQPVVNQPYTITNIPAQLITNTQSKSFKDTMKFLPLVSYTEQQGPEILRPATRGFQGAIAQNTRMDGMAIAITGANPMEEFQELQVENGLGASGYGPANPSGMFDFVLKRAPERRLTDLYLEQDSKSVGTLWLDAGDRLGGSRKWFGYRTNLLFADGTQWVQADRLRRRLAMFAFDVRPSAHTTLDAHYSVYDIVQRGYPGWFSYGQNKAVTGTTQDPSPDFVLPKAPDPTIIGFGQAYAGVNLTTQSTGARLLHDFSPNWHAMMGGLAQRLDRFIDTPVNTISSNVGDYSSSLATGFAPRFGVESDLGYINGVVNRWGIRQDVVVSSEGYRFNQYAYTAPAASTVFLGTANVSAPKVFPAPAVLPTNRGLYQSAVVHQQGFALADMISFPKYFAVRLAASQDWIGDDNFSSTFVRSGGSNKNGISPSASVMFKPMETMTAYATYASSLQQGDIAPGGTVNAGQALAPYRSKEWEVGYKTAFPWLSLTTDLFRLQRPFADTIANPAGAGTLFAIVGEQVNYGAELSGQTTLFHRLLLDGGWTAINARLNDTGVAATNGKRFVGIPGYHSNLYGEYRFLGLADLAITGDWQFTGRRAEDDENLHSMQGFQTVDLGFRYAHRVKSKMATLRFTADNLGNVHYYSTIAAGDITGTNASANTAHFGAPRTISSSLQIAF